MFLWFDSKQLNRIEQALDRMEDRMGALRDAFTNLQTEVSETAAAIQAKIQELIDKINAGGEVSAAELQAQADALDALQKGPLALEPPPEPPTP